MCLVARSLLLNAGKGVNWSMGFTEEEEIKKSGRKRKLKGQDASDNTHILILDRSFSMSFLPLCA